jgi:hypothetical protein
VFHRLSSLLFTLVLHSKTECYRRIRLESRTRI